MCRKSKILSLLLCFCLLFEQTGFAQVAASLDISGHFATFRNSIIQEKFRPLHLRSLGYDSSQNNFRLLLDKGDLKNPKKSELETTTKVLLNYFFIGVTLPNDTFWVNLRPDSENNIIDRDLAVTDVGKILLEADLQLKKDTARFTSPEFPEGKEYWDKLYKKAGELLGSESVTIPTLTRPWIVPGEIIIRETKNNAYIYKATLKVMLEQDYLKDSADYNFADPRLKTLNEYSSQLIRDLIIPKLTKEINASQRYAALRQVYYSLILAQWFKSRFYGRGGLYSRLIDRRNLQGLTSKTSWSKTTYFKAYQKSFKDGEYNIQQPVSAPYGQSVRSYFSGGLVCNIPMPEVSTPGIPAERTEGPTRVTAISGDAEYSPLPQTETIVGAQAVNVNTVDPSETKVTITEEASSPSGLPAGGSQTGASSVAPTAIGGEENQATVNRNSQPDLGAQVSNVKQLDRLLRILNILRKSKDLPEISEDASDRVIIEYCIAYLPEGLITTTTDGDGNVIITISNKALNHPEEIVRRFIEVIQRWAINPEGGVKAVNFQSRDGVWMIVGFESDLQNPDTLEHEQLEIKFRKLGLSWTEAHNQAVAETGKGQMIVREEAAQYRAGRQDEIGAMQGGSLSPKESRRRLIADRLGVSYVQISAWERANPEKAKLLEEMAERDALVDVFFKEIDSKNVIIDRNNPEFTHLYSETEEIAQRLLRAAGFNPDNFSFYLLDSTAENAFIIVQTNKIFINTGLIKFIIENGGSKDALAFVLAHEIRHIIQWVDDTIEGKPMAKGLGGLLGRQADEYDADYALSLIDKAGYSVRDAKFFFAKFLEKEDKARSVSLGFLTHPPTVQRLIKVERGVLKFFWMNFFNKSEPFSQDARREVNNRTRQRKFQEAIARISKDELEYNFKTYFQQAETREEIIFLIMVARQKGMVFDATVMLPTFIKKFGIVNEGEKEFYRIVFDILELDIDSIIRQRGSMMIIRDNCAASYAVDVLAKRILQMPASTMLDLLKVPWPGSLEFDSHETSLGAVHNFNYREFASALFHAVAKRVEQMAKSTSADEEAKVLPTLLRYFEQRWLEFQVYGKQYSPDTVNALQQMLTSYLAFLTRQEKLGHPATRQDMDTVIHYLDFLRQKFDGHHGFDAMWAVHEFMVAACNDNKKILAEWLEKVEGGIGEEQLRLTVFSAAIQSGEIAIFPGMGQSASKDLDILFANKFFAQQAIFSGGFGSRENILISMLQKIAGKYALSKDETAGLYEQAMAKLRAHAVTDELERLYGLMYKEIQVYGEMKISEAIAQRIENDSGIPKDLHPQIKKLIYFYKMGGVLSFREVRNVFFGISARYKNSQRFDIEKQPDFEYKDVQEFYALLVSLASEIKARFEEKDNSAKELRWNKYVLPFALFLSFDRQALSEDESHYASTKPQERTVYGADGKPVRDAAGEVRTELRPGEPTRFGRFVGEFNPFDTLTRFSRRDDYFKTRVDRGRGVNRAFLTGENIDALLEVFDYILSSDKDCEALLDEIYRVLPATAYRNFALYVLFVEKFLRQECGAEIDVTRLFDLGYIQGIIDNLSTEARIKAAQILSRISALMVRDVEMEQINQPNENVLGKLEDAERKRISDEHASEEGAYYPFEFTELGGALSQLDIFVGLLAENNILGALKSSGLSFDEKLDLILKHFTRNSNTRDRFLTLLIENNIDVANSENIEKVLSLFNNESFREKYAVVALEKKRGENPAEFSTVEGELKWILHYFPELSPTRDDILLQLIDEKANTPVDTKKVRPYLLRAPENIREKKQARVVFGTSIFEEYLKNQDAAEKMEFLLWVFGISDKKPFFLKRFEHEYNVSLNGMRDIFIKRRVGYYKNVGDSVMEDFLEKMFLGENGIFSDEKTSGEFLGILFDTLMPNQKNNILRVFYDVVFRRADMNRKYTIVAALLKNFSREKGSPGGINEARAIRIFLESLGLIGVKIAQFLSTYEVVPENIRDELKRLRDEAAAINKDIVFDMIIKIYGSFEDGPLSAILESKKAGSIKVVYRALLKSGIEVALKIKRPEVEKQVEEDLAFLRDILSDPAVQDALRNSGVEIPQQLGNRIAEMIREEMDLKGEVENQARLGQGLSPTPSLRRRIMNRIFNYFISKVFKTPQKKYLFKVPVIIDVQNNSLIIEDFVSGRRISTEDRDAMVAVARELMRQIFLDGFYHADPHPGNIFVGSEEGVLYFIDVGSASQISLKNRYLLYQLMQALKSGDGRKVLRVINKMAGQNMPGLAQNANDIAVSKENVIKKILMVFKALENAQVTVDKELISIFRCFGQGEALFRAALLSEEESSTGTGVGPKAIAGSFEGDVVEVDAGAFAQAWEKGLSIDIPVEHLDVLLDRSMGTAFRTPQIKSVSRQAMDGLAQGANIVRLGNQVLVVSAYWDLLSEDARLDFAMHEGMEDWLERERPGMPAEDAAIDLEGLRINEAERRAQHRGESQQTEDANRVSEGLSRSAAGEVAASPVGQGFDTPEPAKAQTPSSEVDKKGGIDFRALPIVNQPLHTVMLKLSAADLNRLKNVNLDSEWGEIQNMVNAGIIPANERIKEYVFACCLSQGLGSQMNKILGCIADIMRMQEDRVSDVDAELKDMLVIIEAGKPVSSSSVGL